MDLIAILIALAFLAGFLFVLNLILKAIFAEAAVPPIWRQIILGIIGLIIFVIILRKFYPGALFL
jgi:hypothetical protein